MADPRANYGDTVARLSENILDTGKDHVAHLTPEEIEEIITRKFRFGSTLQINFEHWGIVTSIAAFFYIVLNSRMITFLGSSSSCRVNSDLKVGLILVAVSLPPTLPW